MEILWVLLRVHRLQIFMFQNIFPLQRFPLVMSGIAGVDTWYRYRYRYFGIERGIDTQNRYRDEVSKSIDS